MAYVVPPTTKKNALAAVTTAGILVGDVSIPISDCSICYDVAGNLITQGYVLRNPNSLTTPPPEEITITGCSVAYGTGGPGNITGVVRAVNYDANTGGVSQGAAYAWPAGTVISAMISIGIYKALWAALASLYAALSYGYKELTVIQAIVPDNNAATLGQGPELSNGVNYAWASFSHTAAQRLQFVIPMPADWNAGALTAIIGWTTTGTAGGTVKWTLKGYLIGDDGTLNATLATLASVTDTFLAANDLHITAETNLGTPSGSGNLLILELTRDYANDTDTDAARFITLQLKYGRTV